MKTILRLTLVVGFFLLLNGEPPRQVEAEVSPVEVIKAEAKADAPKVVDTTSVTPTPTPKPKPKPVAKKTYTVTGSKATWLASSKISPADYEYVDYIISKESSWNPLAKNKTSGAGGLPQALPYSKTGCEWGDAVCQLNWADTYAKARYKTWKGAYEYWKQNKWW